jgi:hypothetical protein
VVPTRNSKTSSFDLGDAIANPLRANLPADPLIDRVPYGCLGRSTAKLANNGEQLHVADLWKEW